MPIPIFRPVPTGLISFHRVCFFVSLFLFQGFQYTNSLWFLDSQGRTIGPRVTKIGMGWHVLTTLVDPKIQGHRSKVKGIRSGKRFFRVPMIRAYCTVILYFSGISSHLILKDSFQSLMLCIDCTCTGHRQHLLANVTYIVYSLENLNSAYLIRNFKGSLCFPVFVRLCKLTELHYIPIKFLLWENSLYICSFKVIWKFKYVPTGDAF